MTGRKSNGIYKNDCYGVIVWNLYFLTGFTELALSAAEGIKQDNSKQKYLVNPVILSEKVPPKAVKFTLARLFGVKPTNRFVD